jgi:hypothetical protein
MPAPLSWTLADPSRMNRPDPQDQSRPAEVRQVEGQRASIAQLLLVARLRARTRRDLAVDSLERAAHVIFVTCKNWFLPSRERGAPASPPPDNNNKGPDAHRHD